MTKKVFLVDYENTSMYGLKGISELKRGSKVVIFHSSDSTLETLEDLLKIYETRGIEIKLHALKKKRRFNALDFMICTYLGYEVAEKIEKEIYILSADRGYESAIALGAELNSNMKVGFERSIYQCLHKEGAEVENESVAEVNEEEAAVETEAKQGEIQQEEIRREEIYEATGNAEFNADVTENSENARYSEEAHMQDEMEEIADGSEEREEAVENVAYNQEESETDEENVKDKVIPLHSDHKKGYRRYNNGRYRYSKNNYHRSAYRERQSCKDYMQRKMERDNIIPKQYHNQLISFMDKANGRHEFEDKAMKSLGAKNGTLMGKAVMYYEQYQSYKERQSMYY